MIVYDRPFVEKEFILVGKVSWVPFKFKKLVSLLGFKQCSRFMTVLIAENWQTQSKLIIDLSLQPRRCHCQDGRPLNFIT